MTPSPPILDLEPVSMVVGTPAWVIVWGVHVAVPLLVVAVATARFAIARRKARLADASYQPGAPLREGPAVLHGEVEHAQGSAVAMRVTIRQQGAERQGKNAWSHEWTEVARAVEAGPFYVTEPRGARVRVEPDTRALLVDRLDGTAWIDRTTRTRTAELSPGERVYVSGELVRSLDPAAGAYRDAEAALVLRPPRSGRMLLSTEPMGERFRRTAARERGAALYFIAFSGVTSVFDVGFHARTFGGTFSVAEVLGEKPYNGKSSHCELLLGMPDGSKIEESVDYGKCFTVEEGSKVYVSHPAWTTSFSQIGLSPGVYTALAVLTTIVLVFSIVVYRARARPWYEVPLRESGVGRLPEPSSRRATS